MKQNQFEFKPFDQVLVRNHDNANWGIDFYCCLSNKNPHLPYQCAGKRHWAQCIPYNENTAHLIDTNKPYEEPEPIEWHVDLKTRNGLEKYNLTTKEFEQFLTNIVKNNKDITDFYVTYMPK